MSFMTHRGNGHTPPPAGWFIDPADPSRLRWWDGLTWTEHCTPMNAPAMTGLPATAVVPAATGLPATRAAAQAVSPAAPTPPAARHEVPALPDDDPSDVLRRVLLEIELADLERWPLDEQVEVTGMQHHAKEIRKLFTECKKPITAAGVTVENQPCILVPEPWNPHDPSAVAVMVRTYHVGYLSAELASRYHPVLLRHAQQRLLVTGVARVWSKLESGSLVRARVTIAVPEISALG
jgi:hypothetical protein